MFCPKPSKINQQIIHHLHTQPPYQHCLTFMHFHPFSYQLQSLFIMCFTLRGYSFFLQRIPSKHQHAQPFLFLSQQSYYTFHYYNKNYNYNSLTRTLSLNRNNNCLHSVRRSSSTDGKMIYNEHDDDILEIPMPLSMPKSLSPSSAAEFKRCPQSYFFQYILGIKQPTTPALAKGTMCHSALERLYDYPPEKRELELLHNLLREEWQKNRSKENYKVSFVLVRLLCRLNRIVGF